MSLRSPRSFSTLSQGIGLGLFVIVHLSRESTLADGESRRLQSLGALSLQLWPFAHACIELGLAAFFLVHIWSALMVYWDKLKARPSGYSVYRSAGWTSRQTLSSQTMIYTGIILLVICHLARDDVSLRAVLPYNG
jgi:succinate dehydrogenase / fumarate reductase cytochrome b subunit